MFQRYIMFNFEEVELIQTVRVSKAKTKNCSKVKRSMVFNPNPYGCLKSPNPYGGGGHMAPLVIFSVKRSRMLVHSSNESS